MLVVLLLFSAILCIAYVISTCLNFGWWSEFFCSLQKLGLCILAFFVCLGGLCLCSYYSYDETTKTEYELVSMQDGTRISGEGHGGIFYLHSYIGEDDSYSYYYKHGDGYKRGHIESENVIIYESNDKKPTVVKYTTKTKSKIPTLSAILTFGMLDTETYSYEITVPEGSIIETFNLDAQ